MSSETYERHVREHRRRKDEFFAESPRSPVPEDEREDFEGLSYYPPDPDYRFELDLREDEDGETITVETTADGERTYTVVGGFAFELEGETRTLTAYRASPEGPLWVPFRDGTSGEETYGAGRYLDLDPEEDRTEEGRWVVDFNFAYSPFCAYNDRYECPLVPPENWLSVPVRAGEKYDG